MKLSQLKDLLTIVETRSFRAAARQLKMTQPAISRSINVLERELGVTLFVRHKRGAVLTPLGEHFVIRARSAMLELQRGRGLFQNIEGQLREGRVDFYVGPQPVVHGAQGSSLGQRYIAPRNRGCSLARCDHDQAGRQSPGIVHTARTEGAGRAMLCETSFALILALAHTDLSRWCLSHY